MITPAPLGGNRIQLLENGVEYFPALIAAIEAAEQEVLLETYIFALDATGDAVAAALAAAAARGVCVRLLVDGFGARDFVEQRMAGLQAQGVEVQVFRREVRLFSLGRHRLRRLHRKLAMVDGRVAFVGGINIIDDMDTPGQTPPRVDFAVRVEGPLAVRIHGAIERLWRLLTWASLRRRSFEQRWVKPVRVRVGRVKADFLVRDNLGHRREIEAAYMEALAGAQREVWIANAYFFPGRSFRHALTEAAARGVRVTLLLQGRVEYWLLFHASRVLYPQLLASGVRIIEYRKSFLHAKVAVVDDAWATVGSSNIDPFSLLLAREANIVVHDKAFAVRLRKRLERIIGEGGVELTTADWRRLPLGRRVIAWGAYLVLRAAIGMMGYGRRASI